jgi:hypothetical protein
MKYLKSFKIYESINKVVKLYFSDYYNLHTYCELDQNGLISVNPEDPGFLGSQMALENEENMKKTFEPLKKIGVSVEYEGHYSKDGDDYGAEFNVNREEFNKAIKDGKIKLQPSEQDPDEYFVKIV